MKFVCLSIIALFIGGCVSDNPKLVGGRANIYDGGIVGQKVTGDGINVSVSNIWKGEDGVPLAKQYCARFGKPLEPNYTFQAFSGYYKCGSINQSVISSIFEKPDLVVATSQLGDCIRLQVSFLDDLISDAGTIASAVAQSCLAELNSLADLYIANLPNANLLNDRYKNSIRSSFREGKKERVLPYVLHWRNLIKEGWNKQMKPSEEDLPDSLFLKGI